MKKWQAKGLLGRNYRGLKTSVFQENPLSWKVD